MIEFSDRLRYAWGKISGAEAFYTPVRSYPAELHRAGVCSARASRLPMLPQSGVVSLWLEAAPASNDKGRYTIVEHCLRYIDDEKTSFRDISPYCSTDNNTFSLQEAREIFRNFEKTPPRDGEIRENPFSGRHLSL